MATKSKKFSHSILIKAIIFLLMMVATFGGVYAVIHIFEETNGNIEIISEKSFLESNNFRMEYDNTINQLTDILDVYVSEEYIKKGNTVDDDYVKAEIQEKYWDNGELWEDKSTFEKEKQQVIQDELTGFKELLNELERKEEPLYYVTDGKHTYTNTDETKKEQFEKYPVFYISENYDTVMHPPVLEEYNHFYGTSHVSRSANPENTKVYVGYTEDYIDAATSKWTQKKENVMQLFYLLVGCLIFFGLGLVYLIITTGRHSFTDEKVRMQFIDKLYVDINLVILGITLLWWFVFGFELNHFILSLYPITLITATVFVVLLLSLVRHMKNKTFIKHSLLFIVFSFVYRFLKETYDSGSVGMKVIIIVILYPIVTAATLFFFPIIIAIAAWLALKKVKDFQKIQDGTKLMREGHLQHQIEVDGKGEFATLATNINDINDGFKQAIHNELKNERMKTELITNVSHDIRTPLTSLITYTDLLKEETDPKKVREYIDILEQKSKRLKVLTDDLFAAAKASSGDIPVDIQQIDIVALVNQGIGEVSEQINAKNLIFKFQYTEEKMYVMADGKLLWRSIENILSNIFNYALEGSRVYIDIVYKDEGILLSFKNMSKYELNITETELMERFKRGDESRTGQGSGLGLSITKSLVENQHGTFDISIDGDLFKSNIYLPGVKEISSL